MAERIVQEESLVAVADAIRAKGGTTDALSFPTGFADAIAAIQAGGGDVATGTITFDEDYNGSFTITHELNRIPVLFLYYVENNLDGVNAVLPGITFFVATPEYHLYIRNESASTSNSVKTYSNTHYALGVEELQVTDKAIVYQIGAMTTIIKAGSTIRWFAL